MVKYRKAVMTVNNNRESDLFNEVYKEICAELGFETALAIFKMFKGQQITFPVHLFSSKQIGKIISEEYDGSNLRELSKKYGYSEKTIRRIIKGCLQEL